MAILKLLKKIFPNFYKIYKYINEKPSFSGWGMTLLTTSMPWENTKMKNAILFKKINDNLIKDIQSKNFKLNQFDYKIKDIKKIQELRWRHYALVCYTILALQKTSKNKKIFVECGVGDGITSYFILNIINKFSKNFESYLFDRWAVMEKKNLKKTELKMTGQYKKISLNNTKKNLNKFSRNINFIKGSIPRTFKKFPKTKVFLLHIDLNSSIATKQSLNFFYKKLEKNGIIIFDDYGWKNFIETKNEIDKYLKKKQGIFFQIPTGQGIFIKNNT